MNTKFYTLEISEIIELTREAVAIRFAVPEDLKEIFHFTQGQHLIFKATINGEAVRRSYSICGNVKNQELQIAIKRVPEGIFSNYANEQLKVGMTLEVMAPQGHFYTSLKASNKKHYLCIAAGSGITPILSQIRSILSVEPDSRVTLIYVNKSTSLMMFRSKLCFTKNEFMDRFQWINLFTKEQHEAVIFNGRINTDKLEQLVKAHILNLASVDEALICGPESMVKEIIPYLESNGLAQQNTHYELFFSESAVEQSKEKQKQRNVKFGNETSLVTVKLSGRKTSFELPMGGGNILDAALYEGADLPFSCKVGVCATCKAKLLKGEVEMDQNHSLTADEIAEGMILTCQAHPTTAEVDVDFDVI